MENVQLIMDKLTELCNTIGIKVTEFFPYAVKQQYIWGISILIAMVTSLFLLIIGIMLAIKGGDENNDILLGIGIPLTIIFGIGFLISSILFLVEGLGQIVNPEYFAVQEIIRMVK